METCLGIGPSRAGLQSATRIQRRTSSWSDLRESNSRHLLGRQRPNHSAKVALMAIPTDTAEAGAFGTAGAGFESRTRLRNVPGSVASEDEPALVDPWGNAPHRSACKAKQRPFASEPKRSRGAGESNAILLIWNQLGHHGLRPKTSRLVPVTLRSTPLDRRVPTLAGSRGIRALGRGRAFLTRFRKPCTGSAGERIGVTYG